MKRIALALAAVLLQGGLATAGDLDGTQWKMRPKSVMAYLMPWKSDHLIFDKEKFTSSDCVQYGYNAGPYLASTSGGTVNWKAEQTNAQGEKMSWEGTRIGDAMTGKFTWTKKDGSAKTWEWSAKRVAETAAGK